MKKQSKQLKCRDASPALVAPSGLAADYLRSIAVSLESFAEFDSFLDALKHLIGKDLYLKGSAQLCDVYSGASASPDFDCLGMDETVIAVSGQDGSSGYLKYSGREDGQPFGAEDLHLMGALSGVVSALVGQAQNFRKKEQAFSVLQYLINQLPLGVVCFDVGGGVLIENKVAQRLLGSEGAALIEAQVSQAEKVSGGRVRLHLEVDGKLIYLEGRSLEVSAGVQVDAYVLYDLSASRERLLKDLELEAYMSESRGGTVVVALLESRSIAGDLYRLVKGAAAGLGLEATKVQPLDAYVCACVFRGKAVRHVRSLLRQWLLAGGRDGVRVAVVAHDSEAASVAPAQEMIDAATGSLQEFGDALLPELLVMDVYTPVADALGLLVAGECRLHAVTSPDDAEVLMRSGQFDGLVLDVDGYDAEVLAGLQRASLEVGAGFKVYYSSYKQPQMVRAQCRLPDDACVLQKPFDADRVLDAVTLQFNLA